MNLQEALFRGLGRRIMVRRIGNGSVPRLVTKVEIPITKLEEPLQLVMHTGSGRAIFFANQDVGDFSYNMKLQDVNEVWFHIELRGDVIGADYEVLYHDHLRLRGLRHAMGYLENASDTPVRLSQDDATRTMLMKIGDRFRIHANSFDELMDQAILYMDDNPLD